MQKSSLFLTSALCVAIFLPIIYAGIWFLVAGHLNKKFEQLYLSGSDEGLSINLMQQKIDGFPGPFRLRTAGNVRMDDFQITIPELEIRSFLIPGLPIDVAFEKGLSVRGDGIDEILSRLDYLALRGPVPGSLPDTMNADGLRTWRMEGGAMIFDLFSFRKETLSATGSGSISVDENLQPVGTAAIEMKGYVEFLAWLTQQKTMTQKQAMIAAAVLSGFSRNEPETGAAVADINIGIRSQILSAGPIPIATMPFIDWP